MLNAEELRLDGAIHQLLLVPKADDVLALSIVFHPRFAPSGLPPTRRELATTCFMAPKKNRQAALSASKG
jgi:hypothetical protein